MHPHSQPEHPWRTAEEVSSVMQPEENYHHWKQPEARILLSLSIQFCCFLLPTISSSLILLGASLQCSLLALHIHLTRRAPDQAFNYKFKNYGESRNIITSYCLAFYPLLKAHSPLFWSLSFVPSSTPMTIYHITMFFFFQYYYFWYFWWISLTTGLFEARYQSRECDLIFLIINCVCERVCVCVCECTYVSVLVCVKMCEGQSSVSGAFLNRSVPCFLRQSLSMDLDVSGKLAA